MAFKVVVVIIVIIVDGVTVANAVLGNCWGVQKKLEWLL